jgi:hypothetical protein
VGPLKISDELLASAASWPRSPFARGPLTGVDRPTHYQFGAPHSQSFDIAERFGVLHMRGKR